MGHIRAQARSRARPVPSPSLTSPGYDLPPTVTIPARGSSSHHHQASVAPLTLDLSYRDAFSHHAESNAIPTELRDRLIIVSCL